MARHVPRKLTWEDYEKLPDDGFRYEVLEGLLVQEPAPCVAHQRSSWRLCALLAEWQRKTGDRGQFFAAPTDVELGRHCIVEPDVLYVQEGRLGEICGRRVHGAPDLVVEISNRASASRDSIEKLQLYARYGVREYWLVDLDGRLVTMLELADGMYRSFARGSGDDLLESRILAGFAFRPSDIF